MKAILFPVPTPGTSLNSVTEFTDNPNIKIISQETVMVPHIMISYESLSDEESVNRAVKYESRQQRRLCEIAERLIAKEAYVKLNNILQRKEYIRAFEGISDIESERVIELAKKEMAPVRKKLIEVGG
jgi:hypothetical protein